MSVPTGPTGAVFPGGPAPAGGRPRVALTLVSGFAGQARRGALLRWLADRPGNERWAVLVDGAFDDGPLPVSAGLAVFETAAGCACCLGALALRTTLARVLRQGPWQRLFLLLSPAAHPAAILDALRGGIAGGALRIDAPIAIVDAGRPGPWLDPSAPGAALAHEQADSAALIVLDRGEGARAQALAELLSQGPAGPRPVLEARPAMPDWAQVTAALAVGAPRGARRWAGEVVFDRRRLQRALATLRERVPGLHARGVFRTARDWYRWRPDDPIPWQPTHWRLDSRLECAVTDAETVAWLDTALRDTIHGES